MQYQGNQDTSKNDVAVTFTGQNKGDFIILGQESSFDVRETYAIITGGTYNFSIYYEKPRVILRAEHIGVARDAGIDITQLYGGGFSASLLVTYRE